MITFIYSVIIIALPNKVHLDKDMETRIQDDLWLNKECYPETEVGSLIQKALVDDYTV